MSFNSKNDTDGREYNSEREATGEADLPRIPLGHDAEGSVGRDGSAGRSLPQVRWQLGQVFRRHRAWRNAWGWRTTCRRKEREPDVNDQRWAEDWSHIQDGSGDSVTNTHVVLVYLVIRYSR